MLIAMLEDDTSQLELLSHWLRLAGHRIHPFASGHELIAALDHSDIDLDVLLLDWNLPGMSGIDVVKHVRKVSALPVLFCTARYREEDIVQALREGADDYISKPVRRTELLARIQSVSRQWRRLKVPTEVIKVDSFDLDYRDRTIKLDGQAKELSTKEFELAALFLQNIGRGLSRDYIRTKLFSEIGQKSRSLDTHVGRIRNKLELNEANGWRLGAVYGHGYRLDKIRLATVGSRTVRPRRPSAAL